MAVPRGHDRDAGGERTHQVPETIHVSLLAAGPDSQVQGSGSVVCIQLLARSRRRIGVLVATPRRAWLFVVQRAEVLDCCGQVTGHFVLLVFDVVEQALGALHSAGAMRERGQG